MKRDLSGKVFNGWTVLCLAVEDVHHRKWFCQCECGELRAVDQYHLTAGRTTNCGCRNRRATPLPPVRFVDRHGHSRQSGRTKTYAIWAGMRTRCNNPKANGYKYWGGRGIRVCERWSLYSNFLADMGERPRGLSIDRIDNDGNYEPSNCRWVDQSTQVRNSRKCLKPKIDTSVSTG